MSATPTDTPEKTVSAGEDDVRQYMQEIRAYPLLTVCLLYTSPSPRD